ncbi:hypothetical protein [Leucobacter chromiireducens]|uniref:hypothetical protein n=1 Tax=Leucobacter chromiireducens TaxID=283877 RepID=UPI000F62DF85|nr:hypothetical protein [Leucobacter chromiireducens]
MTIWTGEKVMSELGVSPEMVTRWRKTGVLRVAATVGSAKIYKEEDVDRLLRARQRPLAKDGVPDAWIVRLSDPGYDPKGDPTGRRIGWREHEPESHIEAATRLWRIANPEEQTGKALVVLVGAVIVRVWNITGGRTDPESGKAIFDVEEPTKEQEAAYLWRWLELGRGTGLQRWPQ